MTGSQGIEKSSEMTLEPKTEPKVDGDDDDDEDDEEEAEDMEGNELNCITHAPQMTYVAK